jgi:hypothetical protein
MEVTQEPDFGPRPVREHGSLLVLALLAFAVGGALRKVSPGRSARSDLKKLRRLTVRLSNLVQ